MFNTRGLHTMYLSNWFHHAGSVGFWLLILNWISWFWRIDVWILRNDTSKRGLHSSIGNLGLIYWEIKQQLKLSPCEGLYAWPQNLSSERWWLLPILYVNKNGRMHFWTCLKVIFASLWNEFLACLARRMSLIGHMILSTAIVRFRVEEEWCRVHRWRFRL